jgi:hypothetical protein
VASAGREPALGPVPAADPTLRYLATADRGGVTSAAYDFHVDWPVTWRVVAQSAVPEAGVLIELATGRVLLASGEAARGAATVLAQRPDSAAARAAVVKKGARNVFPDAKLKPLAPLVPGSRRELFRERRQGAAHAGEVTTLDRGGVVYFLVLNAAEAAYPKLKDEYATVVRSLAAAAGPAK